jgi:hypothetical protein
LGPVQQPAQGTLQPRWARLSLWQDPLASRLIAFAALLNALAFAWLIWHYPSLPDAVALQFRHEPGVGVVASGPLRPLSHVWTLPAIGLATLATNVALGSAAHPRGRLAAVLLAAGAVLVQVAIGVVIVRIGG